MVNPGADRDNVLLAEAGLVISQTRIVGYNNTYAMASISSCRQIITEETNTLKKFLLYIACAASVLVGLYLAFAVGDTFGMVLGAVIAIVGLVGSFIFIKPNYYVFTVLVGTNAGEIGIVDTIDETFADRVQRAVNDAIVARG